MFLCDQSIQTLVNTRQMIIEPFDIKLLRPASYILRLSDSFSKVVKSTEIVDPICMETLERNVLPLEKKCQYVINPQEAVLASTVERLALPCNLLGIISGLSHIARLNISVHCSSFLINPGFGKNQPSTLTLELHSRNPAPVRLYAGMPVCHLMLARLDAEATHGYDEVSSVYTGQTEPIGSRYYQEFSRYIHREQNNR